MELGLDSLTVLELRNRLATQLGRSLPSTLLYDHPTIAAVAKFILGEAAPRNPIEQPSRSVVSAPLAPGAAIVGIGCRFMDASSPEELLRELLDGDVALRAPGRRFGEEQSDPKLRGGFLSDARALHFDPAIFGIDPEEADGMDPQHRLLLLCAFRALEDAQIDPASLDGARAGVFIGATTSDHYERIARAQAEQSGRRPNGHHYPTGISHAAAAGRISHWLGIVGPSVTVDTACSSSLVALHQAMQALQLDECDLAIVGAVNVMLSDTITRLFAEEGVLSADGSVRTFDSRASGYVRGEGCGVIVLKRANDARHDRVRALVRGSSVNHNGHSARLEAPNGVQQEAVIRDALRRSGLQGADIDYVEAHGTATLFGDAVEMHALGRVFAGRSASNPLLVGAAKANAGHLEAASGMLGLVKIVAAFEHGWLPKQPGLSRLNDNIQWSSLAALIVGQNTPWIRRGRRRRAGLSAFSFQGTNAHVILEEPPPPAAAREPWAPPRVPLVLSAHDQRSLELLVARSRVALADRAADWREQAVHGAASRRHFPLRFAALVESGAAMDVALSQATERAVPAPGRAPRYVLTDPGPGDALAIAARALDAHAWPLLCPHEPLVDNAAAAHWLARLLTEAGVSVRWGDPRAKGVSLVPGQLLASADALLLFLCEAFMQGAHVVWSRVLPAQRGLIGARYPLPGDADVVRQSRP
jgi:acyl transferase domain-containing protein